MKKIIIYISIMVSNCASLGAQSRELTATAILDFSQDKEHLLLKRLQTPLLNIDFGNSFEYLKFPFPLNDSLTCQIEGKGTYCSKNKMELSGTCCT